MLVRLLAGLAVLATAVVAAPGQAADPGRAWSARPATYGVVMTPDVAIPMSDGVVLSADVYRPAGEDGQPAPGRFPVLMTQTPYNKNVQNPAEEYFVERGYVDVVVDVRGTGSSGGAFQSFSPRSQLDSKELVAWAAAQPWSTGQVGLHGTSYYAINQLLTAAQQPPALRAIFPIVPTGDNYRSVLPGGYLTSLAAFAVQNAVNGAPPPEYTASDPQRAAATLSTRPENARLITEYLAETMTGGERAFDGPYYRDSSPLWMVDRIRVPTFLVGGWYDALSQRDVPLLFNELRRRDVEVKMLMGPWYHTNPGEGLPAAGVPSLQELQLRWFDRHVRGAADPELDALAPVTYTRVGQEGFRSARTWPVPGVDYQRLSLSGGGALTRGAGSGAPDVLPWTQASGACSRSTYIGTFGLAPTTPCATDNSLNDRTGLTYDLPVEQDLDLTGPMSAHLFVSTSRSDAFVTLHVEDVDPATGAASELTSGWDTLSFRALDPKRTTKLGKAGILPFHPYTRSSVQQLTPGEVYEWWVEIRPIAARIPAGHLLRLSIQTSDTVRFLPTAPRLADSVGSVLTVHHDAANRSGLVIPVG